MQQLFSVLPVIGYTFEKNYFTPKENFNIMHLLKRFDIVELLRDRSVEDFYLYVIDDGDTPETVAYKLYGNPYYYYIIMIFNNVYDIYSDCPNFFMSIKSILSGDLFVADVNNLFLVMISISVNDILKVIPTGAAPCISS